MNGKKLKATIREYGFLAEPYIAMSCSSASSLVKDRVASFEQIAARARAKSDLSDEAFAPVKRLIDKQKRSPSFSSLASRRAWIAAASAAIVLVLFFSATRTGRALAGSAFRSIERIYYSIPIFAKEPKAAHTEKPVGPTESGYPHHIKTPDLEPEGSGALSPVSSALPAQPTALPSAEPLPSPEAEAGPSATPDQASAPGISPICSPAVTLSPMPQHTCGDVGCTDGEFNGCTGCSKAGGLHLCAANFPDPILRASIAQHDDHDGDGVLKGNELELLGYIDVTGLGVRSLEGIQLIEKLRDLRCANNQITQIDLSHNALLDNLICSGNDLTELDLSGLGSLSTVVCENSPLLSEIWLEGANHLSVLRCSGCALTRLDLSSTNVEMLDCSNNRITKLTFKKRGTVYSFDISGNRIAEFDFDEHLKMYQQTVLMLSPQSAGTIICEALEGCWQADLSAFAALEGRHERITTVFGLNAEGEWVQGAYHVRKGLARFDFEPEAVKYTYDTGRAEMSVELAVSLPD